VQGMRPATELLHDEQCNPAGPKDHSSQPRQQDFAHLGLGDASRSPGLQRTHNRCFFQAQRYPVGAAKLLSPHPRCRLRGGGAVTDFDVTVVSPRQRPARYSQPCPEPIPTYRRKSSLKSNCAPSRIENIKTRWLGCLPKETLGRPSTTPLHYGRVNRRRDMGHHNRVEGEFLSGRLQLHDEADVGGIVEGAWENVYAGIRHVGSFVVYYPSQRS